MIKEREPIRNVQRNTSIILTWSKNSTEERQKKTGIIHIPKVLHGTVSVNEPLIFLYLSNNWNCISIRHIILLLRFTQI